MARKPLDRLSPRYRARIERAMAKGKSRQEARGHRPGEARKRREREIKERRLSSAQNDSIRRWYRRTFNPNGNKGKPSEDTVVEEARERGYRWFQGYRNKWNDLRRGYVRQVKRGTYSSKGEGFLVSLGAPPSSRSGGSSGGGSGGGYGGGSYGGSDVSRPSDYGEADYGDEDDGWEDYYDDDSVPDETWLFYH